MIDCNTYLLSVVPNKIRQSLVIIFPVGKNSCHIWCTLLFLEVFPTKISLVRSNPFRRTPCNCYICSSRLLKMEKIDYKYRDVVYRVKCMGVDRNLKPCQSFYLVTKHWWAFQRSHREVSGSIRHKCVLITLQVRARWYYTTSLACLLRGVLSN